MTRTNGPGGPHAEPELETFPIAITGMHRSGTSMITRALHDSGLHLIGTGAEDLIDAAEDNPEGFWENKAIVACNDDLLEATGGSWDNPPDLPPLAVDDPRVTQIAEAGTAALAALGEHEHWGFKDPRTCLTAAYWLDLQPDLRFIVCVRHPLEVALSLKRRNQNSYSLGLALWERYYATVLDVLPPDRRIVTHYDTFFVDPEGEIARLCAFAGLTPAPHRVRTELRHHTIGVGLGDAGASPSLRALYQDLCREAGAPLPVEPPADEGRVRRLILDGAVARRHADQRQTAIDRLQEREDEHRNRIRELEGELAAARREGMVRIETMQALTKKIDDIDRRSVRKTTRRWAGKVVRVGRRFIDRTGREAGIGDGRDLAPTAEAATAPLPQPTQPQPRPTGRVVRPGVAAPEPIAGPIAGPVTRRLAPTPRSTVRRLPPTAQEMIRRNQLRVRRASVAPVPTAKQAVRRLPTPAQQLARRAWRVALRYQNGRFIRALVPTAAPKPSATPKGPAFRLWKDAYERMVAAVVPDGTPWLAITPGSPREVRDARTPRATAFPDTRKGRPFADDLSHIAHLEALRYAGHHHLVLPEGSRPWFRRQAELRDHVVRTYRTIADEAGAGAVFDLTAPALVGARSLRGEVSRLAAGAADPPAVLDWTDLDLDGELSGLATFRPPPGDRLPYLDASVDLVVVDETHDRAEAARVAALGVITVSPGASGVEVRDATGGAGPAPSDLRVLVWSSAVGTDDAWRTQLATRVAAAGADLRLAAIETIEPATSGDHDVIVVVEPHVLPLPGMIEAAAKLAATDPGSAVAGKVLRADGRLEAAGGTVFFDRSVGLIAGSSAEVRAPWHDYVRPVCWAPGLVAAASSLWAAVPGPPGRTGREFLREWCADVWAHGGSVVYQPTVAAVRVTGDGAEPTVPLDASSWQRVLDLRPARPLDLSDGAWRYLLAHDDVEACRS